MKGYPMATIISEAIEEALAEAGYAHPELMADARRVIERANRQKRLDRQASDRETGNSTA